MFLAMRNNFWAKLLLWVLVIIFMNFLVSSVYEYISFLSEMQFLETTMRVGAESATQRFNTIDFGKNDTRYDNFVEPIQYDLTNGDYYRNYTDYLDTLDTAGGEIKDSNAKAYFKGTVNLLKTSAAQAHSGKPYGGNTMVYSPMQFGYTFVDLDKLNEEFDKVVRNITDFNLSADKNVSGALAFTGPGRLGIISTECTIEKGPTVLDVSSDDGNVPFSSIFGMETAAKNTALQMLGIQTNEKSFDFLVSYKIKFTVYFSHKTVTPFYRNPKDGKNIVMNGKNENGFPISFVKTYNITN